MSKTSPAALVTTTLTGGTRLLAACAAGSSQKSILRAMRPMVPLSAEPIPGGVASTRLVGSSTVSRSGVLPGAGGVPVLVLQVGAGRAPAAGRAAGAAESRDRAAVRRAQGKDGSPRITAALRDDGWRVSENTVAALMREQGLAARQEAPQGRHAAGKGRWRAPDQVKRKFAGRCHQPPLVRRRHRDRRPGRASCTWTACWTWDRGGSSGTPWAPVTTRSWPAGRWSWRPPSAAERGRRGLPQRPGQRVHRGPVPAGV